MTPAGDRELVIEAFDTAYWPHGYPTLEDAWLGIYQVIMYYDTSVGLLHINEVSALRTSTWRERAERTEALIAGALGIAVQDIAPLMDRMMQLQRWFGMQRHNPTGHGFRILVAEILRRWGNPNLQYMEEEPALNWFPGIRMPGRSEHPRIDVFITKNGVPRAILSCKWGIRHDRISDPTNECQEYRAAAVRRQIDPFEYFVVTNEFDGARLEKVLDQPCLEGLIHTSVGVAAEIVPETRRLWSLPHLFDLEDFVKFTHRW